MMPFLSWTPSPSPEKNTWIRPIYIHTYNTMFIIWRRDIMFARLSTFVCVSATHHAETGGHGHVRRGLSLHVAVVETSGLQPLGDGLVPLTPLGERERRYQVGSEQNYFQLPPPPRDLQGKPVSYRFGQL